MIYGASTNPCNDIISELRKIKSLGFDYAEIIAEQPRNLSENLLKKSDAIKKVLETFPFPKNHIVHAPYWTDLSSLHKDVVEGWMKEIKKISNFCDVIEIDKINFHARVFGMMLYDHKAKEMTIRKLIENFKKIREISKCKIVLENGCSSKREICDLNDFKRIVEGADIYVNVDIGHAFVVGGMNEIKKYLLTFQDRIVHMHIHDNSGKEDEHLSIGRGKIDFKKFIELLKEINYQGTMTIENFKSLEKAQKDMKKLKKWLE